MKHQTGFRRSPNTQSASWFLDLNSARRLDLDPPYQRRSVWNIEYKQFFIDSLIRNYPAPTIFLQVDVSADAPTLYRVIDGKQRLTALFEFVEDKFQAPDTLSDLGLDSLYFSELPDDTKIALLEYVFAVENISKASPTELNEAFDRLNRNVARLNKQELRHARYGGEFLRKVEGLAEHPFWAQIGIATPARIRRMLDVEYVSELYVVSMKGSQDGKDYLDYHYAANDSEIADEKRADENFVATQDILREIDDQFPLKATRFSNLADFYSLWVAVSDLVRSGSTVNVGLAKQGLEDFAYEIDGQTTDRARHYLLAAVQGSNKKSNRDIRANILRTILLGE
ncbi:MULTISPECIES: DUF262 domain-containing protein [unclassified Micromonospora]|uniref:DUF262 domain-containing protein n=1 Tax=unclassified Micromonospora TaxID=2617518 RepID=UPI00140CCA1E|nr:MULTISPECIES: DUF262 domain-containing protein [unclassified Micromonospora]NHO83323.1 DUF262 domain-containing protein [Micromonospora sp. CMU55-4]WBB85855.1 DUF262 domain-containing protein [Micromonospora sp. WMMC264]